MPITGDAVAAEPLLTPAEEPELARQIEAGVLAREARLGGRPDLGATTEELLLLEELGEQARQRFIRANLRLVAKIARQAAGRSRLAEADLFQEGCLGLMAAVERFDCRLGYKFSTYASFWVRAYIGAAAGASGVLNLPANQVNQLRMLRTVERELAQRHGRDPTRAEVAAAVGRSERWTSALLAHRASQSLDGLDLDLLVVPTLVDEEAEPSHDRPGAELLWHLNGLEREVLALRCGFTDGSTHSYAEIGRRLSISASRARRLERRGLETLRAVCPHSAAAHL